MNECERDDELGAARAIVIAVLVGLAFYGFAYCVFRLASAWLAAAFT